ncbi:DUF1634 domain-containing protein [Lacticaseibacillus zhaodongensis]|uniref:DUF1634 domain-containing protein n=1 Tax=Lacticaseibacillus zhaodongensis TaxID=2668065 RepID=UPI0012D31877|nr:DUF1634 domain-containing protein [Lacticaseibacillus zhaodongensis]
MAKTPENNNPDQLTAENKEVELLIGRIMQIGVVAAAVVLVIGLILLFVTGKSGYPVGVHPHRFGSIIRGTLQLRPYAVIMTGVFLLILTPVLRVVVSIYAFVKEHDRLYAYITSAVLVILIIAMIIGYYGK